MQDLSKPIDYFQQKQDLPCVESAKRRSHDFRVLVVDDELSILELVKTALEALEDYTVSVASHANSALEQIKAAERPFDCLLLDIQMPDTDGVDLLRKIRAMPEYQEVPALMLTAMTERKYVDDAFLAGATDYVNKPFDFLELRSRIKCAHRLVQERQRTQKSRQTVTRLREKLDAKNRFNFDDAFTIEGVDRILRYVEFDNYVAQLAHRKLFNSQTVAVKLQDADLCFDFSGCEQFRTTTYDIAYSIERATQGMKCVFSYIGRGTFLVVMQARKLSDAVLDEEKLNRQFANLVSRQDTSEWYNILIGEPVSLRLLSRAGAIGALKKAIDNVDALEQKLRQDDHPDSGNITPSELRKPPGADRRVYERVLSELFGDDSYRVKRYVGSTAIQDPR